MKHAAIMLGEALARATEAEDASRELRDATARKLEQLKQQHLKDVRYRQELERELAQAQRASSMTTGGTIPPPTDDEE